MSQTPELDVIDTGGALPDFVAAGNISSPFFYFHHHVSPSGTLTVEVLGPNLTFKFTHGRARQLLTPSKIMRKLEPKAAGFLTLVTKDNKRAVLASAISGHGLGSYGDVLDRQPGVLPNSVWTKKVIAVSRVLGMNLNRPWDGPSVREEHRGCFQASHVEVKLAVHAIFVLLSMFDITHDFDNVTLEQLARLRGVEMQDGTRPVFEIYFSRKNCVPCGNLVKKLEEVTGVTVRLCWKHRLERKQYPRLPVCVRPRGDRRAQVREIDEQDIDFGDESVSANNDSDNTVAEDVREVEVIDLTSSSSSSVPPGSSSPIPLSSPEPDAEPNPVDDYLDGLCYRVGQMDTSPAGAVAAIVQFARKMHVQHATRRSARTASRPPSAVRDQRSISKPLPATPVTEPPAWQSQRGDATGEPPRRPGGRDASRAMQSSPRRSLLRRRRRGPLRRTSRVLPRNRGLRARSPRLYSLWDRERRMVNGVAAWRTRA